VSAPVADAVGASGASGAFIELSVLRLIVWESGMSSEGSDSSDS
jgi:hypothetical protein